MSYLETQPIRKDDKVKVTGSGTGFDNATGTVYYVDNLTATATVRFKRSTGFINISKLSIMDRKPVQIALI